MSCCEAEFVEILRIEFSFLMEYGTVSEVLCFSVDRIKGQGAQHEEPPAYVIVLVVVLVVLPVSGDC